MHKQEHQDMANPNLTMPKLKRAFQLLAANVPQRTICEQLHMGRGILSKYKQAADKLNLSYDKAGRMNNEELLSFLQSTKPSPTEKTITTKVYFQTFNDYIEEFTQTKLALVNINWGGTFDSAADGTFESDTDGTIKVMLSHQVVTKKLS